MPSTRSTCSVRPQLFAAGFHNLEDSEGEHACYLNGHAVRFFELSGIIVSLDPRSPAGSGRVNLNLDDGTGLVECVIWQGTHKVGGAAGATHSVTALGLGGAIRCHGRAGRFRGTRQLVVEGFWAQQECLAECWHWVEARKLWSAAYAHKPFRKRDAAQLNFARPPQLDAEELVQSSS